MSGLIETILMVLLFLLAIFLILLILIQRGRGGGLAGLAGGLATQNPFGTKAGDIFTRITIIVASIWILICLISVRLLGTGRARIDLPQGPLSRPPPEQRFRACFPEASSRLILEKNLPLPASRRSSGKRTSVAGGGSNLQASFPTNVAEGRKFLFEKLREPTPVLGQCGGNSRQVLGSLAREIIVHLVL
jgi:protein translocase SecG subunit